MPLLRETDLESLCGGCGKEHDNKFSSKYDEHAMHTHYKTKECNHCGYEIAIRTKDQSRIS